MNSKLPLIFIFLCSQATFAKNHSVKCSFQGLKKNELKVNFGSTEKSIDPDYDFSVEIPGIENTEWTNAFGERIRLNGSMQFPKKGWFGLAFASGKLSNSGWACIKNKKGQELTLTETSGDLTIQASCIVK